MDTVKREARAYAHWYPTKGWRWSSTSRLVCKLLDEKSEFFEVIIAEDETGDHWAWWNNAKQRFDYLSTNINMIKASLANGYQEEEKREHGKLLRVSVRRVEEETGLTPHS